MIDSLIPSARFIKNSLKKPVFILGLCVGLFGGGYPLQAQIPPSGPDDFAWWEALHGYDGSKSWTEYLKYSPGFFGPNALPVQEFYAGRIERDRKLSFATDMYFGHGDNTVDFYVKWYHTFADNRVAIRLDMVPAEYYQTTSEVRDARLSRQWDSKGWAGGDLALNFSFQVVRDKRYLPDIVLSAGFKTASGNKRAEARYFDSPAYNFDINIGKTFVTKGFIDRIEIGGTFGFLCWQTGYSSNPQDDAIVWGFRLDLAHKKLRWENQLGGYSGYRKNGDRPIIFRTRFLWAQKHINYFVQYQHGIKDFPFESFRLGIEWKYMALFAAADRK